MGCTVFYCLRRISGGNESIDQAAGKTVAAAYAIENFHFLSIGGLVKIAVRPADRAPIVDRGTFHRAQSSSSDFEVRECRHSGVDHVFKGINLNVGNILIHTLHLKAKACGEILFISDHHIHVLGDLAINLLRFFLPANTVPKAGAIVEVIRNDRAMFLGHLHRLDDHLGRAVA